MTSAAIQVFQKGFDHKENESINPYFYVQRETKQFDISCLEHNVSVKKYIDTKRQVNTYPN